MYIYIYVYICILSSWSLMKRNDESGSIFKQFYECV